jgi:hypothetical protein
VHLGPRWRGGHERRQRPPPRFGDALQATEHPQGAADVGRVGALAAAGLAQAARGADREQAVKEEMFGRPRKQPRAELGADGEIEAGVGQVQAEGILPVDAGAHGLGGLPVRQPFGELHDGHQRQAPRRLHGPAAVGVEGGEVGVGDDGAERVAHL